MEIIASGRGSSSRIGIAIVPIIGLIFFFINLTLLYPGNYIFDSQDQLAQALSGDLNDWHPPMMAVFWHLLIEIFGSASALLVFQLGLYWLGLGLIADALTKRVGLGVGLMVLLAGVFPLFLYINGLLTKDSEMGCAFLAAFGLLFWHRLQKRPLAIPTVVAAAALLAYGVLVRSNSIFAFGPIVLYFLYSRKPSGYIKTVLLSAVLAVAAL
ncbi:MAG: hypothetical protein JWP38_75, partial [Herbaspirillum sp.]|nr:hypothetical protein [Herbaspirillum sp.]